MKKPSNKSLFGTGVTGVALVTLVLSIDQIDIGIDLAQLLQASALYIINLL